MDGVVSRRRASALTPADRRAAIVEAALPLVVAHGANVRVAQVAQAAGIAEGTVFGVFKDKKELVAACVAAALRPDFVISAISVICLDLPLAVRLAEAVDAMRSHRDRVVALMGQVGGLLGTGADGPASVGTRDTDALAGVRDALVRLFAPEAGRLRASPERLAAMFLSLIFGRRLVAGATEQGIDELIDLFIHGAVGGCAESAPAVSGGPAGPR